MREGPALPTPIPGEAVLGSDGSHKPQLPRPRLVNAEASGSPLFSPSSLWAHPEEPFRAGSLTQHSQFWLDHLIPAANLDKATAERVTSWVTRGVNIPDFFKTFSGNFNGVRCCEEPIPVPCLRRNHPTDAPGHAEFVTAEIRQLLGTGAVSPSDSKPTMVLALGVAAQRTKLRLILDGRPLNLWTPSPDMTYETLRNFQRGLRRKDWMFSIDHKSGYHHLPLTEDSRQYVGFSWLGQFYTFNVLPFGWAPACYIYNTLSSVVAAFIRRMAINTIAYLDDFGFSLPRRTPPHLRRHAIWTVMAVMYLAGYVVSVGKSNLQPSRTLELLGFGIDTKRELFYVPQRKVDELLLLITETADEGLTFPRNISLQLLQRIVGKAQSMSMALPPISIFLRSSYTLIAKAASSNHPFARISQTVGEDLRSLRRLRNWNLLSRWPSERHISLRMDTDASSRGWGGCLFIDGNILTAAGAFMGAEAGLDIDVKEALAIQYTIAELSLHLRDCFLDLHTDNVIVQHTVLKGSALSPTARAVSLFLLDFQLANNVIVRVHRIATHDNVVADSLSRTPYHKSTMPTQAYKESISEASLSMPYFNILQAAVPVALTIDACAEPWNAKLPRLITRGRSPGPPPVAVNVFTHAFQPLHDGTQEGIFCFPPISLIAPLWRHFAQTASRGVMLVPDLPTKPWYGALMAEALRKFTLAAKGTAKVLLSSSHSPPRSLPPIPWDLLAIVFDFSHHTGDSDSMPLWPRNRGPQPLRNLRGTPPAVSGANGKGGRPNRTVQTATSNPIIPQRPLH